MTDLLLDLHWRAPDDILALTSPGEQLIGAHIPDGIRDLTSAGLPTSQGVMILLRDGDGTVVGLGTELEVLPTGADGDDLLQVFFTIMLPGRGTLFIHEVKAYALPALMELWGSVMVSGEAWEGELTEVTTRGPSPDGRGVILAGTGEFAGATGWQEQAATFRRVSPDAPPVVDAHESISITLPT